MNKILRSVCLLCLGFSIAVLPNIAGAEDRKTKRVDENARGYVEYRQYCAACHGVFGDGKGPATPVLSEPPADLTKLYEVYGTPLKRHKLIEVIDGRNPIVAHGTRDMPIWGERFASEGQGQSAMARTRGKLQLIVEYLQSIQDSDN